MIQLSPCKGPPWMRSQLPGCTASSFRPCFIKASPTVEKAVTCSLVAKFTQRSVVTCSTQILCCRERTLQTRPRSGVCKPLIPDVMVSKACQNNHSYVSSAELPLDSLRKNLAWWAVTRRTLKNHKTVKIRGWVLARDNTVCTYLFVQLYRYKHSSCQ